MGLFLFTLLLKLKQHLIIYALLFSGSTSYVLFSNLVFSSKLLFLKEFLPPDHSLAHVGPSPVSSYLSYFTSSKLLPC